MGCRLLLAAVVAAAALIAAAAECAAAVLMLHELPEVLDDEVVGSHWSAWYRGCAVRYVRCNFLYYRAS